MRFDVITLFPEFLAQSAGLGVVGRAQEKGLFSLHGWNPRDYAEGNYRRVDDRPFGGGPGMVMLIEPLQACLQAIREADPTPAPVIYLSPQGAPLTQAKVRELAALPRMVLLCGRYEGIDERFLEANVDQEISLGDYVLSGGELGAAVIIDAVARLQDGALNDAESAAQDSFEGDLGLLDCPHYSQPAQHPLGTCRRCCARATTRPSPPGAASSRCSGPPSGARTCWMNRHWARPTANCWSRAARPEPEGQPSAGLALSAIMANSRQPRLARAVPKQTCSTVR